MSLALVVPDPRESPVPVGWCEDVALPALDSATTQEELDEVEGQLKIYVAYLLNEQAKWNAKKVTP